MYTKAIAWPFHIDDFFPPQIESEENVLICLRIIIELHKQFRPPISQEVRNSALFVEKRLSCDW